MDEIIIVLAIEQLGIKLHQVKDKVYYQSFPSKHRLGESQPESRTSISVSSEVQNIH